MLGHSYTRDLDLLGRSSWQPEKIEVLAGQRVVAVSAVKYHSLAIMYFKNYSVSHNTGGGADTQTWRREPLVQTRRALPSVLTATPRG